MRYESDPLTVLHTIGWGALMNTKRSGSRKMLKLIRVIIAVTCSSTQPIWNVGKGGREKIFFLNCQSYRLLYLEIVQEIKTNFLLTSFWAPSFESLLFSRAGPWQVQLSAQYNYWQHNSGLRSTRYWYAVQTFFTFLFNCALCVWSYITSQNGIITE
jgi:hypothetical protein